MPPPPPPTITQPDRDDDDEDDEDDDGVPSFPLPNSIQRAGKPSAAANAPSFSLSVPDYDSDEDESETPALPPKFQEAGALAAPASTTTKGKRVKVAIEKGYSQLDWARLKSSGVDLRVSTSFKGTELVVEVD